MSPRKKELDEMNRYELMNEIERIKERREDSDRTVNELSYLRRENERLNDEVNRLLSQQVVISQYFDTLGRESGKEMWLDVADDLRRGRLVSPPNFKRQSKRNTTERRTQQQGRRKSTRRKSKS
jgi:hypothetical protein